MKRLILGGIGVAIMLTLSACSSSSSSADFQPIPYTNVTKYTDTANGNLCYILNNYRGEVIGFSCVNNG